MDSHRWDFGDGTIHDGAGEVTHRYLTPGRYTVTASQVTGGGDRAYGLNVFIQREEPIEGAGQMIWTAWRDLAPPALIERLRVHLHAGRPLRKVQARVIQAALEQGEVSTALGPGRRGAITAVLTAAALAITRRRPAVIVLSLAAQVDRWYETFASLLREVGLRVYRAHGALPLRHEQRLARALADGRVDILLASAEWVRRGTFLDPTTSAVIIADHDFPPEVTAPCRFLWDRGAMGAEGRGPGEGALLDDGYVRANLRLVDRREVTDRERVLAELLAKGEKTLVFTPDRSDAVSLARRLRENLAGRLPEKDGSSGIAYYHEGLPVRVRRVVEQLFLDGKIRTLVATGAFPELFAPGDVTQVILAGVPQSRTQLWEVAALGGLAGRGATVVLAYRREDVDRHRAALEERYPPRSRLASLYRTLREHGQGTLVWPGDPLGPVLAGDGWSPASVEAALDTLDEAGIIQREVVDGRWRIDLLQDAGPRDLGASMRFAEGVRERAALEELIPWAFGPASAILRTLAGSGSI